MPILRAFLLVFLHLQLSLMICDVNILLLRVLFLNLKPSLIFLLLIKLDDVKVIPAFISRIVRRALVIVSLLYLKFLSIFEGHWPRL